MKKIFSVMLLAVAIIFVGQFANTAKVMATDVYAYGEGGVNYYITHTRGDNRRYNYYFGSYLSGIKNGEVVKRIFFFFVNQDGTWVYKIQNDSYTDLTIYEQGYLSRSSKAQTVFKITRKEFFNVD